jgi:hypothetical protein
MGRAWQQDACSYGEARMGLSLSLEQGHEERIRELLQEDRYSSITVINMHLSSCRIMYSHIMLQFPAFRESDL